MTNLETTMDPSSAVSPPVNWLLRLEGLGLGVLSAVLYARTGASWWWFAALWLVPDLGMLAYFAGPVRGAWGYNLFHFELLPGALALIALLVPAPALLPFALIWFNHIGVDRLVGYGFKYGKGFKFTHLSSPVR